METETVIKTIGIMIPFSEMDIIDIDDGEG